MTEASKEDNDVALARVSCIHYPLHFQKNTNGLQALLDSGSEVNAITPAYTSKLKLKARYTNVGAQKIDGSTLETFGMVLASFQVEDKLGKARFFQKAFLLANTSIEVVLGMPFLTLSNANIQFAEKELTWRSYTAAKALPTTKRIELIDKKEFAKAMLDAKSETFMVHVSALEAPLSGMTIHLSRAAQIIGSNPVQVAALKQNEALTKVPTKYSDFADVFSEKKALVLPEQTDLNEHAIELEGGKQPPYGPIYSLGLVELETLKTYIETHLKTGFIWPFKFLAGASILFNKKSDDSLCLCVHYWGLNNLMIKNQYPLRLIGELLDQLDQAK